MEQLAEKEKIPLNQRYLALLVAAHYLGGALRRLNEGGLVSQSELQVALTESGNNVEEGVVARFLREEALGLGITNAVLGRMIETGFHDAFEFIHGPQIMRNQ